MPVLLARYGLRFQLLELCARLGGSACLEAAPRGTQGSLLCLRSAPWTVLHSQQTRKTETHLLEWVEVALHLLLLFYTFLFIIIAMGKKIEKLVSVVSHSIRLFILFYF